MIYEPFLFKSSELSLPSFGCVDLLQKCIIPRVFFFLIEVKRPSVKPVPAAPQ